MLALFVVGFTSGCLLGFVTEWFWKSLQSNRTGNEIKNVIINIRYSNFLNLRILINANYCVICRNKLNMIQQKMRKFID